MRTSTSSSLSVLGTMAASATLFLSLSCQAWTTPLAPRARRASSLEVRLAMSSSPSSDNYSTHGGVDSLDYDAMDDVQYDVIHANSVTDKDDRASSSSSNHDKKSDSGRPDRTWSVTDDWSTLSLDSSRIHSEDIRNTDVAQLAALRMENFGMGETGTAFGNDNDDSSKNDKVVMNQAVATSLSPEEEQLNALINQINLRDLNDDVDDATPLPSSPIDTTTTAFEDDMGREIAMLVRCNEDPQALLLAQGRAVPELSHAQRTDVRQLVELLVEDTNTNGNNDNDTTKARRRVTVRATLFLQEAISQMFDTHASRRNNKNTKMTLSTEKEDDDDDDAAVLDRSGVAAWMQQSLQHETVGQHDKRVTLTIAKYGTFGKGYVTRADFVRVYESAIAGDEVRYIDDDEDESSSSSLTSVWSDLERHRGPELEAVWRDLANHGIVSPAEFERNMKLAELKAKIGEAMHAQQDSSIIAPNMLDECEILDDLESQETSLTTDRQGKSSHERVELVPSSKGEKGTPVPLWMKDGDYVFIDEQSCIGCMQCASAAPSSFQMLEHSGRARTFFQRKGPDVLTAVKSCPVDCMHFVSFDELKEFEVARDQGSSSDDEHFGHNSRRGYIAPTPLHVSRRDSDANHRSSFYHYLKNKCFKSTQCPQRGCFDCPRYKSEPGGNPFFQKRLAASTHVRAEYFKKSGLADSYRKTADL